MTIILNIDKDKFSLNGIPYFKNFMPHVIDSKLRIVNVYDTNFELSPLTGTDQYIVDEVVYTAVLDLQTALVSVVFSRDTLGAVNEFLLGSITPSSVPTGTGKAFWNAAEAGTYVNFGGLVVNPNSFATITRDGAGVFSISQTALDLSTYAKISDIQNLLTSTETNKPLSANQGRLLNENKADLVVGKNKFKISTATIGQFLSATNTTSANPTYDYSDYIAVVPGTAYKSSSNMRAICYYNASKAYVAGGSSVDTTVFTCPAGVYFVRASIYHTNLNTIQIEEGSAATAYESWKLIVNPVQLDLSTHSKIADVQDSLASSETAKPLSANQGKVLNGKLNNKANLEAGKNKFDYVGNILTLNLYLTDTGAIASNTLYSYTDYIAIKPNTAYFNSAITYGGGTYYCFYDVNKTFISSSNTIGTLSPSNAVYARFTVLKATAPSTIQIEEGSAATAYEAYKLSVVASELNLSAYVKTVDVDALIAAKSPLLVPGKNLFNKDSGLVQTGKYVSYLNGAYASNATYAVTGKIEIPNGTTQITMSYKHQIAFYNSVGAYISGSNSTDSNKTQTVPAGAKYVDCTLLAAGADSFMLAIGTSVPSVYVGYKKIVAKENLEIYTSQIINDGDPASADTFRAFLPKEVCVAVGRTIELYNNQVSWCGNINDYHFLWSGVGNSMKRKWKLVGNTIGTNTLTLKVYNKNNVLVATKTTTVRVVSAAIAAPFSVCSIGDSLTNTKAWQPEIVALSGGSISLKGSRGSIVSGVQRTHEGRSGATSAYYLGNNSYTFDSNGTVGNDGRPMDLNPFWNPTTSDVDFAYYKSNYNQNPTKLLIWLGTNGITVDPVSNATNIKTFIDKIRATGGATIPIFVVHTLFRGNQDGIGVQTGSDGYVANSTYKLEEDLKVFNLQEKILADLSAYTNLYLVPVSTCHDSEFNFGAVSTPVNPRASQVEFLPSEATHPQNQGYLQIADIIFSSLAANQ
jgi:hypothetical protein